MKKILLISFCSFLVSCSHVLDFKQPGNRFNLPETSGKPLGGSAGIGYSQGSKITTGSIYTDYIFSNETTSNSDASLDRSRGLALFANLGIIERLDISWQAHHDTPSTLGLKFQVFGDGEEKRSEGPKISIGFGYGSGSEDESDSTVAETNPDVDYKATLDIDTFDMFISAGWRFNKKALVYLSAFYTKYQTETKLTSLNGDFTSSTLDADAQTSGINLGAQLYAGDVFAVLEIGVVKTEWNNQFSETNVPLGVSAGVTW